MKTLKVTVPATLPMVPNNSNQNIGRFTPMVDNTIRNVAYAEHTISRLKRVAEATLRGSGAARHREDFFNVL